MLYLLHVNIGSFYNFFYVLFWMDFFALVFGVARQTNSYHILTFRSMEISK